MKLDRFDGGLRTKPAPHLIGANEAREYVNIDVNRGTLTPLKDKVKANVPGAKPYGTFYIAENEFVFADTPTDYVEYQNRMYFTDRVNKPQKIIDGVIYQAGIDAPESLSVDPSSGPDTVTWAVTFYNSVDGSESGPLLSEEYDIELGTASEITVDDSGDPQIDRIRLYRVGEGLTRFSLVAEYSATAVRDGSTFVLVDDYTDTQIDGRALPTANTTSGEEGFKYLTESYAMLFAAKDSRVYFTPIDRPWSWPALNFLSFPRPITAIGKTPNGLIACTQFETFVITGTGPGTVSQQLLSSDQGAINHDSLENIQDATMWASSDGICFSNGGPVEIITKSRLDKVAFDIDSSAMYDQKYYAHLTNGRTLVIDFDTGVFQYLDNDIESVFTANNVLYGYTGGNIYKLFEGRNNLPWEWKSGRYIGQGFSVPKLYKYIRVYVTGSVEFKANIDDKPATSGYMRLSEGMNEIKILKSRTRGFFIDFEAKGTGEILEITWEEASPNG